MVSTSGVVGNAQLGLIWVRFDRAIFVEFSQQPFPHQPLAAKIEMGSFFHFPYSHSRERRRPSGVFSKFAIGHLPSAIGCLGIWGAWVFGHLDVGIALMFGFWSWVFQ
jgi:hypothetical protein